MHENERQLRETLAKIAEVASAAVNGGAYPEGFVVKSAPNQGVQPTPSSVR
jgi:hypothetical protein